MPYSWAPEVYICPFVVINDTVDDCKRSNCILFHHKICFRRNKNRRWFMQMHFILTTFLHFWFCTLSTNCWYVVCPLRQGVSLEAGSLLVVWRSWSQSFSSVLTGDSTLPLPESVTIWPSYVLQEDFGRYFNLWYERCCTPCSCGYFSFVAHHRFWLEVKCNDRQKDLLLYSTGWSKNAHRLPPTIREKLRASFNNFP